MNTTIDIHDSQSNAAPPKRSRAARRRRRPCRSGFVLVLVAASLFALMALAALVIDMGFVRLTQGQMQSGVNSSALEGLRWRDVQRWEDLPAGWVNSPTFRQAVGATGGLTDPITSAQQDAIRRWAAANVSTLLYHQPADPTDAADPAPYGVGPEVQITNNPSGSLLGPLIAPGDPPVYQPQLQSNSDNAIEGDIVAGTYGDNSNFPVGHAGQESDDYQRNDFSPAAGSASGTAPGLLARMRRVAPGNPLDREAGTSSAGDALPFLFGRGTPMDRQSAEQGVSVRATAIAAVGSVTAGAATVGTYVAGAANSVGWAQPASSSLPNGLIGAVPMAIDAGQWQSLAAAQSPVAATVASNGTLSLASGQPIGYLADQSSLGPSVVIGATATPSSVLPSNQPSAFVLLETAGQVIGFGAIDSLTVSDDMISFLPVQQRVASSNASAVLVTPLPAGTDAAALWSLHDAVSYPLYAPTLINRLSAP